MLPEPDIDEQLLVRCGFNDNQRWVEMRSELEESHISWLIHENRELVETSNDKFLALIPNGFDSMALYVADEETFSTPEMAILVIDLYDHCGTSFRSTFKQLEGVVANLSMGNMGFNEFANCADADGVFRGF